MKSTPSDKRDDGALMAPIAIQSADWMEARA